MTKIFTAFFLLFYFTSLIAQNEVFVSAKNGLNIRNAPNLKAEKTGKFLYAEKVAILEKTKQYFEVTDDGKTIKGAWYKVKGNASTGSLVTGYVFSGFLTKGIQKDTFEFINYNDDYDYYFLNLKKDGGFYQFINDNIEDRSLLKGDLVEVTYKDQVIYIAGDGDTKALAEWAITVKKKKNGKLANFKTSYTHKITYYTIGESTYTDEYLEKLYEHVEYYIANSKNTLLNGLLNENKKLECSLENRTHNNKEYIVFGIGNSFEHKTNTVQWLFYDKEDPGEFYLYDVFYEYDIITDTLIKLN